MSNMINRLFGRQRTTEAPAADAPRRMMGKPPRYILGETLGVGGYSKVKLGIDTQENRKVALKIMMADPETGEISASHKKQLIRELEAMQKVQHENVIRLYEWDEDCTYPEHDGTTFTPCVLTVLELAPGGELFDFLMYTGHFDEVTSRTYFHQLMGGIGACHDAGLAHRDIKPENLLLDGNFNLKIADFGFAREFRSGDVEYLMGTACGTRGYLSPELLRGEKYSHKADLFACGIILFTLFAGFPPFQNALNTDWWWNKLEIRNYPLFWMAHERTRTFPDPLKDLLVNMLASNPDERFGMEQIQASEWYQGAVLSARELKRHLNRRRKMVMRERAKKAQLQQTQENRRNVSRALGILDESKDENGLPQGTPQMASLFVGRETQFASQEVFEQAIEELQDADWIDSYNQFTSRLGPRETVMVLSQVAKAKHMELEIMPESNIMLIRAGIVTGGAAAPVQNVIISAKQFRVEDGKYRVAFRRYSGDPLKFSSAMELLLNDELVIGLMDVDADIALGSVEDEDEEYVEDAAGATALVEATA